MLHYIQSVQVAILEPPETALVSEYMVELGITPLYLDKAMSFSYK